jgi:hypothetical protein
MSCRSSPASVHGQGAALQDAHYSGGQHDSGRRFARTQVDSWSHEEDTRPAPAERSGGCCQLLHQRSWERVNPLHNTQWTPSQAATPSQQVNVAPDALLAAGRACTKSMRLTYGAALTFGVHKSAVVASGLEC